MVQWRGTLTTRVITVEQAMGHCSSPRRPTDSYTAAVSCRPHCRDLLSFTDCWASGSSVLRWSLSLSVVLCSAALLTISACNSVMERNVLWWYTFYYFRRQCRAKQRNRESVCIWFISYVRHREAAIIVEDKSNDKTSGFHHPSLLLILLQSKQGSLSNTTVITVVIITYLLMMKIFSGTKISQD